jgi:ADP-ribosyl-[dinitrogen reductase] hydrolase
MMLGPSHRRTEMNLSPTFTEALVFATERHATQKRKGSDVPYVAHLLAVTALVLDYGGTEAEAIAALLHDSVEDQKAKIDEIRERFGAPVADIVSGCSDTDEDPKPPWRPRKEAFIAGLSLLPAAVRLVVAADKLHNARTILKDYRQIGEALWSRFTGGRDGTLWYYRSVADTLRETGPAALADELDETVCEIERLAAAGQTEGAGDFIARGLVAVDSEAVAALDPPPRLSTVSFDRVEGILLGLAVGDALGNTSEGMNPRQRRASYGEIDDYLPNWYANNQQIGLPSDDTQLAFWTLECLLRDGRVIPEHLARTFASREIFGIGQTVRGFVEAFHQGRPWFEAAQPSAGNGAVMRIAPVVLPYLQNPSRALWMDAVLAGAVTHNDTSSISACVALVGLIWDALRMTSAPSPEWWIDEYCTRARPLEGDRPLRARCPHFQFYGPVWRLVDLEVRRALKENLDVIDACERWDSGAYLLETIPAVIYILARHGTDARQAILRAVNDTQDNDTIAAIVGAVVGALHGRKALPTRWTARLLGRTGTHDDGRIYELIDEARLRFGFEEE